MEMRESRSLTISFDSPILTKGTGRKFDKAERESDLKVELRGKLDIAIEKAASFRESVQKRFGTHHLVTRLKNRNRW